MSLARCASRSRIGDVCRGCGVGERTTSFLFVYGFRRYAQYMTMQRPEPREGKRVDLNRSLLTNLDETDVEICDQRLDLNRFTGRSDYHQLLTSRYDLPDGGDRHLLHGPIDRRNELRACETCFSFGQRLSRLVSFACSIAELVLIVGYELRQHLDLFAGDFLQSRVRLDQLSTVGGQRRLRLLKLFLSVIKIYLSANFEVYRLLACADALR